MKRQLIALMGLILAVTWFLAGGKLAAQDGDLPAPLDHRDDDVCGGLNVANLLQNPSFEGAYSPYVPPGGHQDCPSGICQTAQMADGWTPYWLSPHDTDNDDIHNPEYKPADAGLNPPRTHDGARAQQYFTAFSTHEAGFYQQVAVTPGEVYCFGIWGHAWSTETNEPLFNDSELEQNIGIDPTGGTDWQSADVIWGGPKQYYIYPPDEYNSESAYGPFTLAVRAEAPQMTVFTWSRALWPVDHNDVYWDDAIVLRAPVEPAMSLSPQTFAILELPVEQGLYDLPVDVSFAQDPGVIWRASVDADDPDNTLDVTLWPMVGDGAAGTGNDPLRITFSSMAYGTGSYEATINVVSEPEVAGSPATVNVSLHVFEEIYETYLPLIAR